MVTKRKTDFALPRTLWGFYLKYAIGPSWIVLSLWFICFLGSWTMRGFFGPMIDKWFYALFQTGPTPHDIIRAAIPTILFCMGLRLVWNLGDAVRAYINAWWGVKYQDRATLILNEYVANQTMAFHRDSMPGKLYNYIGIISSSFRQVMDYTVLFLSAILILLLGGYAIVRTQEIFMYFIVGFYLIKSIYICFMLVPIRRDSIAATQYDTVYQANILDYIENTIITKLFGIKINTTLAESDERRQSLKYNIRKNYLITSTWAIPNIIEVFVRAIMMFICIRSFATGTITLADAILIFALMATVSNIVTRIMDGSPDFIDMLSRTLFAYRELVRPIEITDAPNAPTLSVPRGAIRIDGVSFAYKDKRVLNNISLNIRAGESVGIVGASGCGKTTLAHLIMRFYDPKRGRILIDGTDIKTVSQDSLHAAISFIPQEPTMFNRTLWENIGYGKQGATMAEIKAAARAAQADQFIRESSDGYDTLVGDRGIKLSGGQRQRIAIARAFLKDAPILILDEATSALDSESEAKIQAALAQLTRHRTTIVIAHRLATLKNMDRIIVLDRGRIVESGTHKSLIRRRAGLYRRLWEMQNLA
ncbi:ABC transporter ATP-binding protein [bacterium]|nr:ABC transporter ATP-binding protein [bacterium]